MPEVNFDFRLGDVDSSLAGSFTDVLTSEKQFLTRVAQQVNVLQRKVEELQAENQELRGQNATLQAKVRQLANRPPEASQGAGGEAEYRGSVVKEKEPAPEGNFRFVRSIKIHNAPVHSIRMNKDNDTVATASWDAMVKLHSLSTEETKRTLGDPDREEGKMGGLYAVAFARTAEHILGCTSCDRSVYLWNHGTGKLMKKLTKHEDEVNGIDFHETQQVMCTASDDSKCIIWDFQEGVVLRTLDKHSKAVYGVTFLGQENQYLVATCCFDKQTRIFDMRDKQVVALLSHHNDDVIGLDYSSQKQLLATGSDDGLICLWDSRSWGKLQQTINTREDPSIHDNEVKRIAFSKSGSQLAAACSSQQVLVYDLDRNSAAQVAQLRGHTDCVFDVTWGVSPRDNSNILVSASHDHSCRYWVEKMR